MHNALPSPAPTALFTVLLAIFAAPALADTVTSTARSEVRNGTYTDTVGVSTPEKRVLGTASGHDTPSGASREDEQLLNHVVAALVRDPQLKGVDIRVGVDHGEVTLDGSATDAAQASHARDTAQQAAGPAQVTSNLAAKAGG
ncbi:MAG TPA: BON domain-containing protein [Usitatibacter sp.]|nr:BON domain-containing protein [Usitatibacter sp.]